MNPFGFDSGSFAGLTSRKVLKILRNQNFISFGTGLGTALPCHNLAFFSPLNVSFPPHLWQFFLGLNYVDSFCFMGWVFLMSRTHFSIQYLDRTFENRPRRSSLTSVL